MKRTIIALSLLPILAGCSAFAPIVAPAYEIADRHDQLINGELKAEDLSEAEKKVYLKATEYLRKLLDKITGVEGA